MAAQFCLQCGAQVPADAQFCAKCGHPIGGGAAPAAAGSPASSPPVSPPPTPAVPAQPLGPALGLDGMQKFLLQHEMLTTGRNFRVLSHDKRHLFTIHENRGQEFQVNLVNRLATPALATMRNPGQMRPGTLLWSVVDPSGATRGTIGVQVQGQTMVSTLMDPNQAPLEIIEIQRGMVGGLTARATFPDGREMFRAHGNTMHHNFEVKDPNGGAVAKIHEAWASVRDTYNVDVTGPIDPVCALVFAIMIEVEKGNA